MLKYYFSRQNQTREEKDAEAARKGSKRSAEREEKALKKLKLMSQTDEKWISDMLSDLALNIPKKSDQLKLRRQNDHERKIKSR